jgi:hypothetical protein
MQIVTPENTKLIVEIVVGALFVGFIAAVNLCAMAKGRP